jgi:regulator of sirC expression with transglutaminase-like and TPR domain
MADDRHRIFRAAVELPDDEIDLGRAALAIAQEEYPTLDIQTYLERLDQLAATVRDRSAGENTPYRLIASLNYVLFTQEGYRGNRDDYYDPKNSFLNDVIERRIGIPIALSVLYMEVARRADLRLHGVGFPGHFLVKYAGDEGEIVPEIVTDPFDKGEVRTTEELQKMLDRLYGGKVRLQPEFLSRVSNRQIVQRMLANLKAIYMRQENFLKAVSVVERLVILDPISADEIRDRGLLYLKLERFPEAVDDLETYLRLMPDAADAEEILEQVLALKERPAQVH